MKEKLEDKYIDLIINRCLSFKKSKALFVSFTKEIEDFVGKLVKKVNEKGITDVYLNETDVWEKHEKIKNLSVAQIKKDDYFNNPNWDIYAKKNAAFLMFSSIYPHINDDLETEKLNAVASISLSSKPIYKEKQSNGEISWCIAVMPNEVWAQDKFPKLSKEDAYDKLFDLMMDACMVKTSNPIKSWNKYLEKLRKVTKKLNELEITKMHYKNSLGTDLEIALSTEAMWQCAGYEDDEHIVNMPTYEVFTSPDKDKTNGIVYATKPLTYNGTSIKDFWLKFRNGKVVDYDAKEGKENLKSILESDKNAIFLGECALVSKNSPIAKMNIVFDETCLDENASCHLALGAGFPDCIKNGLKKNKNELKKCGLNDSENHVDFMIGSNDLNIWAETNKGEMLIFKDGDFNI